MTISNEELQELQSLVRPDEILTSDSPDYLEDSRCMSAAHYKQPQIIVRPTCLESLQKVVPYLYNSNLDFAIRSQGTGDASSPDVLLNVSACDGLSFDPEMEVAYVGGGQSWGDVYRKLEKVAPGYMVVGPRSPPVSVGGSLTRAGLSWLSHEYGLGHDPKNLLDVQIVLRDGRVIWASEDPDLLWALRGGGGNFGVCVKFKLKAYNYTRMAWAGAIVYPLSSLDALSKSLSAFIAECKDPRVAGHIGFMSPGNILFDAPEAIILLPVDLNGKTHGEETFKWALEIPGAQAQMAEMPLSGVYAMQASYENQFMKASIFQASALVDNPDPDFLKRAADWFFPLAAQDSELRGGSYCLLEIMHPKCWTSVTPSETAWPHPTTQKHVLQIGAGYAPGANCTPEVATKELGKGIKKIAPTHEDEDFVPNWIPEGLTSAEKVFGRHHTKLRDIKKKYDPQNRFNNGFSFATDGRT